jgi:DNA primase
MEKLKHEKKWREISILKLSYNRSKMDQVEEVKQKTDMVQLVGEYVKLTKAGHNYKGLCPFHGEKTPSFMVNPELQIYKCFGCGEGGDAIAFVEKMEGINFGEALKILARRAGITLESYKPSKGEEDRERLLKINNLAGEYYHYLLVKHKVGQEAREYLKARKISDQAIETYKLGFAPEGWDFLIKFLAGKKGFKEIDLERAGLTVSGTRGGYDRFRNRVMFPLANHRGQIVGFAGRILPNSNNQGTSNKTEQAKYVNTPETEIYHKGDLLYGLDINKTEIKNNGLAVVVEGELDTIASWQAGVKNVVAIKGSALTPKQVELLKRYTDTVVLSLDADVAGDAAARRGIEIAEKAGLLIKVTSPKSLISDYKYKDPGECATEEPELWKKIVEGAVPIYDYYITSAVGRYGLTADGKAKISRELVPIWNQIGDEIVKSHYVGRLADTLGVESEAVWQQMGNIAGKSNNGNQKSETKSQSNETVREMREKRLVQVAILGDKLDELREKKIDNLIKSEFWRKVADMLKTGTEVKTLPAELLNKVTDLLMTEEVFDESLWEEARRLLELYDIEEQLKSLSDVKGAEKLIRRKAELTKGR